jgi:hypothetical protein
VIMCASKLTSEISSRTYRPISMPYEWIVQTARHAFMDSLITTAKASGFFAIGMAEVFCFTGRRRSCTTLVSIRINWDLKLISSIFYWLMRICRWECMHDIAPERLSIVYHTSGQYRRTEGSDFQNHNFKAGIVIDLTDETSRPSDHVNRANYCISSAAMRVPRDLHWGCRLGR